MTSAVQILSPDYAHEDHTGRRIGMWLFLSTEILVFAGLFLLFSVYRSKFPSDFHFAASTLDTLMGTVSTVILLTAGLTMMMATAHLERKNRKPASLFMGLTMLMGIVFLIIRWFEWSAKFQQGLYPNSTVLQQHTAGENVFYSLYYLMTGIHALHIVIALIVSAMMFYLVSRKPRRKIKLTGINNTGITLKDPVGGTLWENTDQKDEPVRAIEMTLVYDSHADVMDELTGKLENAGLYWHTMNVTWIFLFTLFYLVT